jgi:hypothetical protein
MEPLKGLVAEKCPFVYLFHVAGLAQSYPLA